MTFSDKINKLDYLLKLINNGNAGNASVLSDKICVSPRTLRRLIAELRNQGYQISFCILRNSYYLVDDVTIQKQTNN